MTIPNNIVLFLLLISFILSAIIVCTVFLVKKAILCQSLRTFLAVGIFLFQILGVTFIVFSTLFPIGGYGPLQQILDTTGILSLFPVVVLLTCYILELKNPCSLTPLKMLLFFSPLLLALLCVLLLIGRNACLYSLTDLRDNVTSPDVIARLSVNVLYVAYAVHVLFVRPHNVQKGVEPYIAILPFLLILVMVFCVSGFGFRVIPCLYANSLTLCLFDYLILRLELFTEFPVSDACLHKPKPSMKLQISDEMWKDPEMTAEKLAKILGMNQRYLSEAIKNAGYLNYFDMINSKRVEYICEMIADNLEDSAGHLSEWMYEAGFRSRNTAVNAFKKIKGCTPSEYLHSRLK